MIQEMYIMRKFPNNNDSNENKNKNVSDNNSVNND